MNYNTHSLYQPLSCWNRKWLVFVTSTSMRWHQNKKFNRSCSQFKKEMGNGYWHGLIMMSVLTLLYFSTLGDRGLNDALLRNDIIKATILQMLGGYSNYCFKNMCIWVESISKKILTLNLPNFLNEIIHLPFLALSIIILRISSWELESWWAKSIEPGQNARMCWLAWLYTGSKN